MKKILALALFLSLATVSQAATAISFTWQNGNPTVTNCSTTITKACISGYTLTDTTTNTVVNSEIVPTATTFLYTPTSGISFGYVHTFSLVTNGFDQNGVAISSTPVITTITNNVIAPPTGFTAVIQ